MDRNSIAPGFVSDALACLRARGIDPAPVLAVAGFSCEPSGPVSREAYGALWLGIATAMEDEFFGLGARPMRPGSFALMGHAVLHAATLDQALRRALRFLDVVLDRPRGRLSVVAGEAVITLEEDGGPRPAFAYRTYWLILMGLACWLIGRRIPLRRVGFACAAPPQRQDYHRFFGAPVRFGAPRTELSFDAGHLHLPLVRNEAALRLFLRGAPANFLLRYRHDEGAAARVRARLAELDPADWPGFDGLAADLGIAPATLRRRLRADGQGFAAIREEVLSVRAQRLLREAALSVAEISARLGYSEPGAFHRAFRRWTGESPGAFRTME